MMNSSVRTCCSTSKCLVPTVGAGIRRVSKPQQVAARELRNEGLFGDATQPCSRSDYGAEPHGVHGGNTTSGPLQLLWAWLKSGWKALSLLAVAFLFLGMSAATTTPSHTPTPAYASVTVSRQPALARQVLMYKLQKVFAMNAVAKICAVAAIATPLVVLSAYVYKAVTGSDLKSAMFKTYTILQDTPGADACSEESPAALLVTNITHVIGLFTYALVLSVVVDDVGGFVNEFKRGNTNLYETGHTVILNKNRHTGAVLKQWATAQKESGKSGGAIVLMADVPKEELDVMVDQVRQETGLDVMGREGRPYDINDLNMVSASTASTVILLDPLQDAGSWDDKMVPPHAATLVSLAAVGAGPAAGQTLVVQAPNTLAGADVLQAAGNLHRTPTAGVVDVKGLEALSELQAQCALQPRLAAFHNQVFMPSAQGTEFYVSGFKALEGKTYREARKAFKMASVVGVTVPEVGLVLNPSDNYVIQLGDEIVGLTQNIKSFKPSSVGQAVSSKPSSADATDWSVPRKGVPEYCNKKIIVLCFDEPAPQVTQGLEDFLPKGASVTYVSANSVESLPRGRFSARQVIGSPASNSTLMAAGIENADSVIITGVDNWEATDADIQVLSSVAQLSDVCSTLNREKPLHVVAQARGGDVDNFNDALASIAPSGVDRPCITTDILFTDDLVAGILTQSALEPKLAPVITDILDAKGNRVTLRNPSHYTDPGESVTMGELEDRVRAQGDTVVGYYKNDGSVMCACSKTATIRADNVSHFIIISDTPKW